MRRVRSGNGNAATGMEGRAWIVIKLLFTQSLCSNTVRRRTALPARLSAGDIQNRMALDRNRLLKPVKKLRKLISKLDRQPAPDEVHDLRTRTRRVEASFEALSLDEQGMSKALLKELGRCRKRAGKVRDMDVLTGYASTVHLKGEEDCALQLIEHLGAQRKKYATKLYAEVRRLRPALRKDLKRASAILAKLVRESGHDSDGSTAGPEAASNAVTLAVQLSVPPRLDRETLHPYRLK